MSVLLLAIVSLSGTRPNSAPPAAGGAEVPAGSGFAQGRDDAQPVLPGASAVSKPPEARGPAAPPPDTITGVATAPAVRPDAGMAETPLAEAPPVADGSGIAGAGAADRQPDLASAGDGAAPQPPMAEVRPTAETRPAAPPLVSSGPQGPRVEEEPSGFPTQDLAAAAESPAVTAPDRASQPLPAIPPEAAPAGSPGGDGGPAPTLSNAPEQPSAPAASGEADAPEAETQPDAATLQPDGMEAPEVAAQSGDAEPQVDTAPALPQAAAGDASGTDVANAGRDASPRAPAPEIPATETAQVAGNADAPASGVTEGQGDTAGADGATMADAGTAAGGQSGSPVDDDGATGDGAAPDPDASSPGERLAMIEGPDQPSPFGSDPAQADGAGTPEVTIMPGRTSGRLTEGGERQGRLPTITSGGVTADAGDASADAGAEPDTRTDDPSLPPIRRFGQPFDRPEGQPLMSIVLMDDGTGGPGGAALDDFPFPLTVALDPARPGAAEAMDRYRAAGFDVALLADLPEGATAQDLETAFQAWQAALPRAVAVMETPELGLQRARGAADHLPDLMQGAGMGLLLYPNGFDTVRKLAVKGGVPAATLFRDFDADGQSTTVIRRFLDHAAFKAAQGEPVVMVGRLSETTVQALLLWGLQDRASRVALAPLSALLLAQLPEA